MKMLMVAYNEAMESEVMEALERSGLRNYTKFTGVLGKGNSSGSHFGTLVWPVQNHMLLAAVEDETVAAVMDAVRALRGTVGHEGVKAFVLPLEEVT